MPIIVDYLCPVGYFLRDYCSTKKFNSVEIVKKHLIKDHKTEEERLDKRLVSTPIPRVAYDIYPKFNMTQIKNATKATPNELSIQTSQLSKIQERQTFLN